MSEILPIIVAKHPHAKVEHVAALGSKNEYRKSQTASTRTEGFLTLFDYHTSYFAKALEGMAVTGIEI